MLRGSVVPWAALFVAGCACGAPMTGNDGSDSPGQDSPAEFDAPDGPDGPDGIDGPDVPEVPEVLDGIDGADAADADGTSDGPADAGMLTLTDLPAVYVTDVCTALTACYGWQFCSLDQCRADFSYLGTDQLNAEIARGWVTYDASLAAACRARFEADPCHFGFFFFVPTIQEIFAYCPGVLTGNQGSGQPCVSRADCTPDTFCVLDGGACPGTCTSWLPAGATCSIGTGPRCDPRAGLSCRNGTCQPPAMVGDPCSATAYDCGNLWCDRSAGACVDYGVAGDICNDSTTPRPPCAYPIWCDALFTAGGGHCRNPSGMGGPCFFDADCLSPYACIPTTGFPDPGVCDVPGGTGAPCDSCADCSTGLVCTSANVCGTPPGLGAPCGFCPGLNCATGLSCDPTSRTCEYARCPGEPCSDGMSTCVQASCQGGTCRIPAADGQPCTANADCASASCVMNVCTAPAQCLPP